MMARKKQTTAFNFALAVGLVVTGMLSACGGGSEGNGSGPISPDNKLLGFVGTYSDNQCRYDGTPEPYSASGNQLVISPSTKPDTLNLTETTIYYKNDDKGNRCGVKIGSSVAYGELKYEGTAPSVEFSDSSGSPVEATKVLISFNNVVNEGVYGSDVASIGEYGSGGKTLLAKSDNLLYAGDHDAPLDAQGFPTKLSKNNVTVGRTGSSSVHQLSDYLGTYLTNQCAFPDQYPFPYTGSTSKIVFSASDKPDTVNVASTITYYEFDRNKFVFDDQRCGTPIGSSTALGEMTLLGSLPSVQFYNLTNPPMGAEQFRVSISQVLNQGVVDKGWDEPADYNNLYAKSLFALDGRVIYVGNFSSPRNVEGFPTQLDQYSFWIRQ